MKWGKGVAGIILVFATGMALGWVVAHASYRKKVDNMLKGGPEAFQDVIVKRMNRKLKLDSQQEKKLREILLDTHDQMVEAREELNPEIQEILREAKNKVGTILKPEQMKKFEKMALESQAGHYLDGDTEAAVDTATINSASTVERNPPVTRRQ